MHIKYTQLAVCIDIYLSSVCVCDISHYRKQKLSLFDNFKVKVKLLKQNPGYSL